MNQDSSIGTPTPAASKYPLKGTVITREEFATETRRQKRLATRTNKPVKWQEARSRAYQALLKKHYPRIK